MQHPIDALSRLFQISVRITVALALVILRILISDSRTHLHSGGLNFLVMLIIAWVTLPLAPVWKAFHLQKTIFWKDR